MTTQSPFIRWFGDLRLTDVPLVGGKNASLGELYATPAELFDGFSIGSNDLTQLTLGVDRDSAIVAFDFDERDPGMLEMLRLAVTGAHEAEQTTTAPLAAQ